MGISKITTVEPQHFTQHFFKITLGRVAKQADASDLKSGVAKATCGFEPRLGQSRAWSDFSTSPSRTV